MRYPLGYIESPICFNSCAFLKKSSLFREISLWNFAWFFELLPLFLFVRSNSLTPSVKWKNSVSNLSISSSSSGDTFNTS